MSHIYTLKQLEPEHYIVHGLTKQATCQQFRMFCHLDAFRSIFHHQRQPRTTFWVFTCLIFCLIQEKFQRQQVASSSVTLCFYSAVFYVMFSCDDTCDSTCLWEDSDV